MKLLRQLLEIRVVTNENRFRTTNRELREVMLQTKVMASWRRMLFMNYVFIHFAMLMIGLFVLQFVRDVIVSI